MHGALELLSGETSPRRSQSASLLAAMSIVQSGILTQLNLRTVRLSAIVDADIPVSDRTEIRYRRLNAHQLRLPGGGVFA